jgi:hypothetical protein
MNSVMLRVGLVVALLLGVAPASAAVTATFYSHKFRLVDGLRTDFPHGFVVLAGNTDDGTPVNVHLGFSAKNIFVDVLWHPVDGALDDEELTDAYVSDSIKHFSLALTDAQYHAVMAVEHKWRTWPQPSYEIDTHNCVTFVKELAVASGLQVSDSRKFIHTPADFLEDVAMRNAAIVGRDVTPVTGISSLQDRVEQLRAQAAAKK